MKLLAIDTSGPVCGAAVLVDGVIRAESTVQNKLTHSANLLPMIDAVMTASGLAMTDLDRLAVVVGPGSFTGVRIGVSTVKGLAHGAGLPCVGVDALEAMAAGVGADSRIICPIQDARAGQVYGAAFRAGLPPVRLLGDAPMKLEDFLSAAAELGDQLLFLGDGMAVHRDRIEAILGERACFAPPHLRYLRPAAVAALAEQRMDTLTYEALMPLYLRAPSAERNRKLMEAAAHDSP